MQNMVINFLVFFRLVCLMSAGIMAIADNYEGAFWALLFSTVSGAIVRLLTQRMPDDCLLGGKHEWRTLSNGEYTKVVCGKCGNRR